ncbi:uncharacterized protein [Parasteatoda tepidariorum]|nr:surfeit locus protein 6 homolog [Parasteatoda tepidariorum]
MTNLSINVDDSDFDKVKQSLLIENEFLIKLIDTIPAKIYFNHDIQERILSEKHAVMDEKAEALKKGVKRIQLSAKGKHKRARLDPLCQKSVSEIHKELEGKKQKKSHKNKGLQERSVSLTRAANIEELQNRLQEKIKEFRDKRKSLGHSNSETSRKLLTKLKKIKQKANKVKKEKQVLNPHKPTPKQAEEKNPKPVYNKEGKIIYSKLDFTENGEVDNKKSEFSGKNYKKLLKKAEAKKEKIKSLKETNPELAVNLEEKEKWKKAILKAENVKVKDDPSLLKKTIKKTEKIKQKKAKVWKERKEQVEGKKQARQEKRTKNIEKRKKAKLDSKIKRAKKKGRVIPGF